MTTHRPIVSKIIDKLNDVDTCVCVGGNWGAVESAPNKNFGSMCFQLMLQNGSVGVALLQEETSSFFHE